MGFLGFGKEEQKPFKVPKEISELRMRIEIESREKFPSLARYQQISKVAGTVCQYLNDLIAKKDHPEEAARIKEDIKKKLETLGDKIKKNMQEAQKEGKQDYVESNIDYLERKSMRNNAKTAFTELLVKAEAIEQFAEEGKMPGAETIEAVAADLFASVAELQDNYFKLHDDDKEIVALKEKTLQKLAELEAVFHHHKTRFREKGLDGNMEMCLNRCRLHE
jgi:hypothetical protein